MTFHPIEEQSRDRLAEIGQALAEKRELRARTNDQIRALVAEEKQVRRVVAVFDRANPKAAEQ
jgi:uncharacterized coiled-coil protein SlyX